MRARLSELRIGAFKSIRDARVPLTDMTLVVGRNGSGKSNILDALSVLNALSSGISLRDALDGGRDGTAVRGGSEGCAPIGENTFELGCTVSGEGEPPLHLDLKIQTIPSLQIVQERLWSPKRGGETEWLASDPPQDYSADIVTRWNSKKRGKNPPVSMRADQLLTSQVNTRVPATTIGGREVHERAAVMLEALSGIFLLDPVPHQMREYVPERDNVLRRNGENLSAVLSFIADEADRRDELLNMTRSLSEAQVSDLSSVTSDLGDVMVTLEEKIGGQTRAIPARLMSDGTLRFLSIAAAMLDPIALSSGSRLLVVEEIENGLHPSQASLLISRLKEAAAERGVATLATTHSPAILDSLAGEDHESVVVVTRDAEGWSRVTRLVEFPDYFEVAGQAPLGERATEDALRPGDASTQRSAESPLATILGL
ncbi:AAA family ATPase [Serinicoccus sp. CUA-874]|uniref:AAA family ATPase n=1 Tax=Serinicoccus sp. CUA-874 TaxID=1517939 RepID=UPI00096AB94A|nr:ATP-binding protein [Serinicoccus sp. CUA-874]